MSNKQFNLVGDFKAKQADDGSEDLVIQGYANTVDKDRHGDIVAVEAWTKGGLDNYLMNPIVLAYHDHSKPIGSVVDHYIDSKGLHVVAKISKAASEVYALIKDGVLKTFSIGFRVKDAVYDSATDIFVIKDLELFEISVVSVPANQSSIFSVKKSFENEDEFDRFKKQFDQASEASTEETVEQNEADVDAGSGENTTAEESTSSVLEDQVLPILKAIENKLIKESKEMTDNVKPAGETTNTKIDVVGSGVEDLVKALTARLEASETSVAEALKSVLSEVKEHREDIVAMQRSKMSFNDRTAPVAPAEVDSAIMVAKALGRKLGDTKLGRDLLEKAGAHMADMDSHWEEQFSTRIFEDMRQNLIIEPLFRGVPMNAPVMQIPVNPEAGYGEWISSADYNSANSTGTAATHLPKDITLTAYKLVTKEYLGYEEEEDTLLPLANIIRDAVVRRMAKSADKALLIGAGSGTTDPISGLTTIAATDMHNSTTLSIGAGDKLTAAKLSAARKQLGIYGLDPREVKYIVSTEGYYDLLDDPDFRTMDMVGINATILTGQVGSVNGSPVIVSGEFAAKAAGAAAAVAVNTSSFMTGSLRGMLVERDRNIEMQRNVLVASRRMGFLQVSTGNGVASVVYAA